MSRRGPAVPAVRGPDRPGPGGHQASPTRVVPGRVLVATRGLPGSGKTTWANAWLARLTRDGVPAVRVSRDDVRAGLALDPATTTPEQETQVTTVHHGRIRAAFTHATVVVLVDDTHLDGEHLAATITAAGPAVTVVVADFRHLPVPACTALAATRPGAARVGADRIRALAARHGLPTTSPGPAPLPGGARSEKKTGPLHSDRATEHDPLPEGHHPMTTPPAGPQTVPGPAGPAPVVLPGLYEDLAARLGLRRSWRQMPLLLRADIRVMWAAVRAGQTDPWLVGLAGWRHRAATGDRRTCRPPGHDDAPFAEWLAELAVHRAADHEHDQTVAGQYLTLAHHLITTHHDDQTDADDQDDVDDQGDVGEQGATDGVAELAETAGARP